MIRTIIKALLLFLTIYSQLSADDEIQTAWFIKFFPLVIHPREERMDDYYKYNLSDNGWLARGQGGIGGVDIYNSDRSYGVRIMQGIYEDCAGMSSGFSHIGFRQRLINTKNHNLNWGIGPTYMYRESWSRFDNYGGHWLFEEHGDIESAFILWGGEFEYNYKIKENIELSTSIAPAVPAIIMMGFGIKVWY